MKHSNADHAAIGAEAVALIAGQFDEQTDEENLTDLLANLRHYADAHELDFHRCLDASYQHYSAERQEEAFTCDWCEEPIKGGVWFNDFDENLCDACAKKCCETCGRGLTNDASEHEGCTMKPLFVTTSRHP